MKKITYRHAAISLLSFGLTFAAFSTTTPALASVNKLTATSTTKAENKQLGTYYFFGGQYSILRREDRGAEVTYLQQRLRDWGYFQEAITGYFGIATEKAVQKFQQDHDIFPSGIVDAQTWEAIESETTPSFPTPEPEPPICNRPTLKVGAEGQDVSDLQERLYELGYLNIRPTGYFGQTTVDAVKRFQNSQDLPPTGIVDAQTWSVLGNCQSNNNIFTVLVQVTSRFTLEDVRQYVPDAYIIQTASGNYVYAGKFRNQQQAEERANFLRARDLNAWVDIK